jgi:hypothetical protein
VECFDDCSPSATAVAHCDVKGDLLVDRTTRS